LQPSFCDWAFSINPECEFVTLIGRAMLSEPFVENTHQAPSFGRFWVNFERASQVPLSVCELPAVQGLPAKDQFCRVAPGNCPPKKTFSDSVGAAFG
jgi:hypothetical protein